MSKRLSNIFFFVSCLIIIFLDTSQTSKAEEITEQVIITELGNISDSLTFEIGLEKDEILSQLPNIIEGTDNLGNKYNIALTWEMPEEFNSSEKGIFVLKAQLEQGYIFDGNLPELVIEIEDGAEENTLYESKEMNEAEVTQWGGEGAPTDLKLNLLEQAYGVKKQSLSFSWQNSLQMNMKDQAECRIVISNRLENMKTGNYIFDSGWIGESKNTSVIVGQMESVLEDNELYYWQVQVKDILDTESPLSEPQAFTTAVADKWSSKSGVWGERKAKVVFLRNDFNVSQKSIEKAVANVTATSGLGTRQYVYNLYINGEEIGLGPTRPDNNILYYHSYDVTDYLSPGKNTIGSINYSENNGSFLCQITVYYSDGTSEIVINSGQNAREWRSLDGDSIYLGTNAESIGTSYYVARQDNVNAERYPYGWDESSYTSEGSAWKPVSINNYIEKKYDLQPYEAENMHRYIQDADSIEKTEDGSYVVDFGKEIVGSIQLDIFSDKAEKITLKYGEELDDYGEVKYKLNTGNNYVECWTLKTGEQLLSGIGMKTFRYLKIENFSREITLDNVKGIAIRQKFEDDESKFESSNDILNSIYNLCKYTIKAGTQDLLVDTQNRERLPYEGDTLIQALSSYSFSAESTVASYSAAYLSRNSTWPAEYPLYNVMTVYQNYLYTGDVRNLASVYENLKKNIPEDYFDSRLGLMNKKSGKGTLSIMIDWPATERDEYAAEEVYYNTVFNAVCVGAYKDMASIALALGQKAESEYFSNISDTIKASMIKYLYNKETGEFYDGLDQTGKVVKHSAQHATAYALAFGIYEGQPMADEMSYAIENDCELKMSVFGTYFLLQGLYNSNNGKLARKIMSNPDSEYGIKSWAYMMNGQNATVTTETWNSSLKPNMSLCHAWGTAPASMLVRGMFGIQPTSPGYDTFRMKLQPGGISHAALKVPTLKGNIDTNYTISDTGNLSVEISVPANMSGEVSIPILSNSTTLTIDGQEVQGDFSDEGYIKCSISAGVHVIEVQAGIYEETDEWVKTDIAYDVFAEGKGWTGWTTNDTIAGDVGIDNILGLKFRIKNPDVSGEVKSSVYMQSYGWQGEVSQDEINGRPESGKRTEAFRLELTGELAEKYNVYYRSYLEGYGWLGWAQDGEPSGSSGYGKKITSIQAVLTGKDEDAPGIRAEAYKSKVKMLNYSTHVQTYGWQQGVGDGDVAGTTGQAKRLEAIKIFLNSDFGDGGITYSAHIQSYGWQSWRKQGEIAGTSGEGKRLEAIKIKLTGKAAEKYDVYYRVHAQTYGWLDWAKNGEAAGTSGYYKRLEAIQIILVKKGNSAPGSTVRPYVCPKIKYSTHVQTYGWQQEVYDGATAGTVGQGKRLEGIKLNSEVDGISGGIQYQTHVQTYGWEAEWKRDGEISGTMGKAKRLEAIKINLTGGLAENYDIYYRVHAQTYGWLGWAKNGEPAGTSGYAKRLEAIQIVCIEKGEDAPDQLEHSYIEKLVQDK